MADGGSSQYSAQPGGGSAAVDVMDVIMRGWDTARRNMGTEGDGKGGEEAGLFCGFAYGSPGTFCPLFYWHADSVTKEA